MRKLLLALPLALLCMGLTGCPTPPAACTATVSSLAAVQPAVDAAKNGDVICLADGTYGKLNVSATGKTVMVQAQHPGAASLAGATVSGRGGVTVARFHMLGAFEAAVGSRGATAFQNFFDLNNYGGFGVIACNSSSATCDDVQIVGNRFTGESEEDAIRANRYHDTTADSDPYGLSVVGNEFSGNVEKGDHNDVFQSVWVGDGLDFSYNYLHDFGGQGFFVKDQASPINGLTAEQNLIVNQDLPCRPASLCPGFQLSPFQLFGPVANARIDHNTVGWGSGGGTGVLTGSWTNSTFSDNVFNVLAVTNSGGGGTVFTGANNSVCQSNGWPVPPGTQTGVCSPPFLDPANNDYRLADGRGVTWTPSQNHYGP